VRKRQVISIAFSCQHQAINGCALHNTEGVVRSCVEKLAIMFLPLPQLHRIHFQKAQKEQTLALHLPLDFDALIAEQ